MNIDELIARFMRMFPEEAHANITPILKTLLQHQKQAGVLEGRNQSAAMIEMLILGDPELDLVKLKGLVESLRYDQR